MQYLRISIAPTQMCLLNLPLELFRKVLAEAVQIRGIRRAVRLRLVNRVFQEELIEALCASNLIKECYVDIATWPWVITYMERHICERRTKAFNLLNTIDKIARRLIADERANSSYQTYALQLLQLASTDPLLQIRGLLQTSKGSVSLSLHDEFLTAAAFIGYAPLVQVLADINIRPGMGPLRNPFQAAVRTNNRPMLDLLLTRMNYSEFTLYFAIEQGNLEIVNHLLGPRSDGSGPWINIGQDKNKETVRVYESRMLSTPNVEIFGIVLTIMQSRDVPKVLNDELLRMLLAKAVGAGWKDMVKHLILLGAPLDRLTKVKRAVAPLYTACSKGYDTIVRVLLENEAKPSCWTLQTAVKHGNLSVVKILLETGGAIHNPCRAKILYTAARKGFKGIVQLLLDAGADPNGGDDAPLVGAVEAEHTAIFRLLVDRGAIVSNALPEALRRAEAAGLESMSAFLQEYPRH